MSYQPYPVMADSGVGWIGQIPADWAVVPLRYLARIETGSKDTVNAEADGDFPFFVRSDNIERIGTYSYDCEAVLTAGDGAGVGKVFHHVVGKFEAHQRVYVISGFDKVCGRYFYYYLAALFAKVALDGTAKSTVDSLRRPMFSNFLVSMPRSMTAQEEIAYFLDRETAQIDELIVKQNALIELLVERRKAVITRAVGRTLAGHGTEWPLVPLKRVIESWSSGTSVNATDTPATGHEVGVLKTSCVSTGKFDASQNKVVLDEEITRVSCPVEQNVLIVNRANTPSLVGSAGWVQDAPANLYLSDKLWQIKFDYANSGFVYYWTITDLYRSQLSGIRVGTSASMQNISFGDFRELLVPVPPMDEQERIVRYIDFQITAIDDLVFKARAAVNLLKERRSALVTAAVTGKIDVRERV